MKLFIGRGKALAVVVLALGLAAGACGGDDEPAPTTVAPTTAAPTTAAPTTEAEMAMPTELDVAMILLGV